MANVGDVKTQPQPEPKKKFTTEDELKKYEKALDKEFSRKNGKDKFLYSPINLMPSWEKNESAATEDKVTRDDGTEAYPFVARYVVETFEMVERPGAKPQKVYQKGSGWLCDCSEFLDKFQPAA